MNTVAKLDSPLSSKLPRSSCLSETTSLLGRLLSQSTFRASLHTKRTVEFFTISSSSQAEILSLKQVSGDLALIPHWHSPPTSVPTMSSISFSGVCGEYSTSAECLIDGVFWVRLELVIVCICDMGGSSIVTLSGGVWVFTEGVLELVITWVGGKECWNFLVTLQRTTDVNRVITATRTKTRGTAVATATVPTPAQERCV